jgi:hypothetical protein
VSLQDKVNIIIVSLQDKVNIIIVSLQDKINIIIVSLQDKVNIIIVSLQDKVNIIIVSLQDKVNIIRNLEKTTDLPQVTDKYLSHNVVSSTPRLSEIRTHNVSGDRQFFFKLCTPFVDVAARESIQYAK